MAGAAANVSHDGVDVNVLGGDTRHQFFVHQPVEVVDGRSWKGERDFRAAVVCDPNFQMARESVESALLLGMGGDVESPERLLMFRQVRGDGGVAGAPRRKPPKVIAKPVIGSHQEDTFVQPDYLRVANSDRAPSARARGIRGSATTRSTHPVSKAALGMPKMTLLALSWASV